MAADVKTN